MKSYLIPLVLLLTTISCQNKKSAPLVLSSNGNINTITVVMTDQLWAGTIGQAVRDMYAYPSKEKNLIMRLNNQLQLQA